MLENQQWQAIPGAPGGAIFPVIRRLDATCSNTWLLRTANSLAVIDPGADPEQTALVLAILLAELALKPRPVRIFLTHCHRDHAWAGAELLAGLDGQADDRGARILVHEAGLRALRDGDPALTVAYLFDEEVPPFGALEPLPLAAAPTAEIDLGEGVRLEIEHTPGHSPDSVVYRVGALCFPGDLAFAANPGVAGIPGWDRADFLNSLERLRHQLSDRAPLWIGGGHGAPMDGAAFVDLLARIQGQTLALASIAHLDAERVDWLRDCAARVFGELADLFTLIGGRLQAIGFHLETLEETAEAERIARLLDDRAIETLIAQFQRDAAASGPLKMAVPLRARALLTRILAACDPTGLRALIEPSWLRRAQGLGELYCNLLQGLPAADPAAPQDLNAAIAAILAPLRQVRHPDDDWLDAVEDPAAFAELLAARIGGHDALHRRMALRFEPAPDLPPATIGRLTLEQVLLGALDELAARRAPEVWIGTSRDPAQGGLRVTIAAALPTSTDWPRPRRLHLLELLLWPCGGRIARDPASNALVLELPAGGIAQRDRAWP